MRSGKNRAFDEKNFLPQGVDHGNAKNIRFFEKNFFSQVVEHEIAVFMNGFVNFIQPAILGISRCLPFEEIFSAGG